MVYLLVGIHVATDINMEDATLDSDSGVCDARMRGKNINVVKGKSKTTMETKRNA